MPRIIFTVLIVALSCAAALAGQKEDRPPTAVAQNTEEGKYPSHLNSDEIRALQHVYGAKVPETAASGQVPASPPASSFHSEFQQVLLGGAKERLNGGPIYCDDYSTTSPDLLTRAEEGDMSAQREVGSRYATGDWVTQDVSEGIKWLTKAAEQGDFRAPTDLMDIYVSKTMQDNGQAYFWKLIGRPQYIDSSPPTPEKTLNADQRTAVEKKALEWKPSPGPNARKYDPTDTLLSVPCLAEMVGGNYEPIAKTGDAYAQIVVGKYLKARKNWQPPDYLGAYYWFSLAAKTVPFAKSQRDEVAKNLSPEQKAAVEKKLLEWKPTPFPAQASALPKPTVAEAIQEIHSQAEAPTCRFYPKYYEDLKVLHIYLDYDYTYAYPLSCRGHEEECAKGQIVQVGLRDAPQAKIDVFVKQEAARLRSLTDGVPSILYPEPLSQLLQSTIKSGVAEYGSNSTCPLPTPTLLESLDSTRLPAYGPIEDTLTLTLGVTFANTNPRIAILTLSAFRPNGKYALYEQTRPRTVAMPITVSEEEAKRMLDVVLGGGVLAPYTHSPAQP